MPQEKIDTIQSIALMITGGVAYKAPEVLEIADKYMVYLFHFLSVVSVAMVVVLNRKKFINEVNSWFK